MESKSQPKKVVIIGGGPCGLGAAWRLNELNHNVQKGQPGAPTDWCLVDMAADAGGLARSFVDEKGFTWDVGGHVIFSHYQYFTQVVEHVLRNIGWNEKVREAWAWMRERWIPYPVQNNIWRLPQQDLTQCLDGLVAIQNVHFPGKPKNFHEWLERVFGKGLMDVFMTPYNKKVWAYPPEEMNVEWMGERVATVDLKQILRNVVEQKDTIGWGPNNVFKFPLHGGTGAIWTKVYEHLPSDRFVFKKKVVEIDAQNHTLTYADGQVQPWDAIVSTMPLNELCMVVKNIGIPQDQLHAAAKKFKYSSTHVIGIGLQGQPPEHLKTKCWMYFPEEDCPFYRVTVFSNYSKYNVPVPDQQWSLMCEVAESAYRPVDGKAILDQAIQGLINTKLITAQDVILSRFHIRLEYGYPTPFFGREELCKPIFEALLKHKIYSRGRFGAWKYEISNQDHSMMQGVEAVDHFLFQSDEMTFNFPDFVNRGKDLSGKTSYAVTNSQ